MAIAVAMLAPAGQAGAIVPSQVTIDGPEFADVGVPVEFTGTASLFGIGLPDQTVKLVINSTLQQTTVSDGSGNYAVSYSFLGAGVFSVRAETDGLFQAQSPTIQVIVGEHTLTVLKYGEGTVTSEPDGIHCGSVCARSFPYGTTVVLTATPAPGWVFDGWGLSSCPPENVCSHLMTHDRTRSVFFVDVASPSAPHLSGTTPGSPSNSNTPTVHGLAQDGSTVRLYKTGNCTGPVVGTQTATGGGFAIGVTVPSNSTTSFSATATDAGGTSACSNPIAYVEDSTPPSVMLTHTVPTSPANDNHPHIHGVAELGAEIFLFTDPACSGLGAGADTATNGPFSIQVFVNDNTTTTFYAIAVDEAGNVSPCSNGVTYSEVS